MAKKNIADKYWIYGEDAELAARLTSYLTRVVYNQRANYIRALMKIKEHECSIEDVIRILNLNPCAQVIHWRKVLNPS